MHHRDDGRDAEHDLESGPELDTDLAALLEGQIDDHYGLDGAEVSAEPSTMDKVRRSPPGAMLAAAMLGMRDVLEGRPEREETVMETDAPQRLNDRFELFLDPDHADRSYVVIHPPRQDPEKPPET